MVIRSIRTFASPVGIEVLAVSIGYALLAALAYGRGIGAYFVSDDFNYIARSLRLPELLEEPFFRPLVLASFRIDHALYGLDPVGFHLTNLALHVCVGLQVTAVASRLAPASRKRELALCGALFLVLPSHSESVAWISGRSDLLAAAFGLAGFLLYLGWARSRRATPALLASLCWLCALLSKEAAIFLPAVALAHEWLVGDGRGSRRRRGRMAAICGGSLAVLGLLAALRVVFLGSLVAGYRDSISLAPHPRDAWHVVLAAMTRTFLPPMPDSRAKAVLWIVACGVLGIACWARFRTSPPTLLRSERRRVLAFLAIAGLLALVPAMTRGIRLDTTEGERILYFSTVFTTIALFLATAWSFPGSSLPALCVLVVIEGVLLQPSVENWARAGALSRAGVTRVLQSTRSRVVLANVPDSLRGAYVFRNGLPSALRLIGGDERFDRVLQLSKHTLADQSDRIALEKEGDSHRLELLAPTTTMQAYVPKTTSPEVLVLERGRKVLRFTLLPASEDAEVLYWSEGAFLPIHR